MAWQNFPTSALRTARNLEMPTHCFEDPSLILAIAPPSQVSVGPSVKLDTKHPRAPAEENPPRPTCKHRCKRVSLRADHEARHPRGEESNQGRSATSRFPAVSFPHNECLKQVGEGQYSPVQTEDEIGAVFLAFFWWVVRELGQILNPEPKRP